MIAPQNRTGRRARQLKLQILESRQLLAANVVELQNPVLPEDVNADGEVTGADALIVINAMRQPQADVQIDNDRSMFRDVNGDGQLTSVDALRVINRMSRQPAPAERGRNHRPDNPQPPGPRPDDRPIEFRSIDGSGNNLDQPLLGSAGVELRRLVDADYTDDVAEPAGTDRGSAREISNIVAAQVESIPSDRNLSDLVWQWGQFIDHDITLTEGGDEESLNIEVPVGDPYFDPFETGQAEIEFTRSAIAAGTGVDTARQQVNGITAFIDGSMIYGSDDETAAALRSFEGGQLRTSEGDLLPIDESGFFLAGDVRANEQNGLTAMHTLWVREHNRIAEQIAARDPSLADEQIYQLARARVIGEIQAITYNEYLPVLLGRNAISRYDGYDATVDPSISNLFATAAFRYGHTSLSSELKRLDDEGNVIEEGNLALRDAFFNPSGILELGIDPLLKGLASNVSQEINTQLVDDVRNFLFGRPGAGGFDLAALNIQRGRDHGLPDYNSARLQLGLQPAESFADISSDPEVQAKLREAYGSLDDIDVWVGALAEDHVRGASVGELVQAVLVEQFTALRDGDRFWYENVFAGEQLRELRRTRLSDVIERNTELTSIQVNAFVVPGDRADRPDRPDRLRPPQLGQDGNAMDGNDENGGDQLADQLPPPPPPLSTNQATADEDGERPRRSRPPRPDGEAGEQAQQPESGLGTFSVDQVFSELGA